MLERKQVRSQSRLPATNNVVLRTQKGQAWVGDLVDLSIGGARMKLKGEGALFSDQAKLTTWCEALNKNVHLPVTVLNYDSKLSLLRVQFSPSTEEEHSEVVAFALADSRRWMSFQRRRTRAITYWYGAKHVLRVGLKPALLHFLHALDIAGKKISHKISSAKE